MRRIAFLTAGIALAAAPAAHAAGWSGPASFAGSADPVPRAAIARDGTSLTVWNRHDHALVAAAGGRLGGFAAPIVVTKRRVVDYAVAVAPHGQSAVAYEARDGIHVATRSGRGFKDRRVAASSGSGINGIQIAADPLGGWVVAERWYPAHGSAKPYRVRVLSLDDTGRPLGDVQDLGEGEFGIAARAAKQLAVRADGTAVLAYETEGAAGVLISTRPHQGTFSAPAPAGKGLTDPSVSVSGNDAVVAAVEARICGDSGCAGAPKSWVVGSPAAPGGPALAHPTRSFAASATTGALVFELKHGVHPFSREAPVVAFGAGRLQTLTATPATEPVALPLQGGTLALWATKTGLGAAKAPASGRFHRIAGPPGPPPPPYHFNPTNRDFAGAGPYVLAAWSHGSTVRVSVRRF